MFATLVKPFLPRHTTQDLGEQLVIKIPSPKQWFSVIHRLFAFLVQVGLVILLLFVLLGLPTGNDPLIRLSFILILISVVLTTIWLLFAFYSFLWTAAGVEMIQVTSDSIMINRVILGQGSPKEYLANSIKDLRLVPSVIRFDRGSPAWMYSLMFLTISGWIGLLAFDYGSKTCRFAAGIDEAEAKQILAEIQHKFPQYRATGFSNS